MSPLSRRNVLKSAAIVPAASLSAVLPLPALSEVDSPDDAELIALLPEFLETEAAWDRASDEVDRLLGKFFKRAAHDRHEAVLAAIRNELGLDAAERLAGELLEKNNLQAERICKLRATSIGGLRAKAKAHIVWAVSEDEQSEIGESIIRDLIHHVARATTPKGVR